MVSINPNLNFNRLPLQKANVKIETEQDEQQQLPSKVDNKISSGQLKEVPVDTLLSLNGIKIDKPEDNGIKITMPEGSEKPSIEVNSHFEFDNPLDFERTRGKEIYKHGDTIHYRSNGKEYNFTYKIVWIDDRTYVGFFESDTGSTFKDDVYSR